MCASCGAVQKVDDAEWRADCDKIYSEYDVYCVSQGQEQSVRSGRSDSVYGKRSELILNEVAKELDLPSKGTFLDFGCGSGVSSMAVSKRFKDWTIDGFDLDRRMESDLLSISGFNKLYVGNAQSIDSRYDLIMLTHVLEHVPKPIETLNSLAKLLKPGGAIVVQVPNRVDNDYDLLVADHLLHFDSNSLSRVCLEAGLDIKSIATDWVMKELSVVAVRKDVEDKGASPTGRIDVVHASVQLETLESLAESLRHIGNKTNVGFFGTSLVAVWMAKELGHNPRFYVDEDPAKIGRVLNGVKILAPSEVPIDSVVIPAMASGIGKIIAQRYSDENFKIVTLSDLVAKGNPNIPDLP